MASLCHPWFTTTNLSYRFPIFETSATALCGTTGRNNKQELPKTFKKVGPVQKTYNIVSFEGNQVFQKTRLVFFNWTFTMLSKLGRPASNFSFTCSNSKLTSEICQHRPQLPPGLPVFPLAGLGVVKKSICTCLAFQKSAFQIWTQRTDYGSDHRCVFLVWIGKLSVSVLHRDTWNPKTWCWIMFSQRFFFVWVSMA